MPGEGGYDYNYPEDVVVDTIEPQRREDATHILERWRDFEYVEVDRAYSEEEARTKAQKIANNKEISIRIRLSNEFDK